MKAKLYVIPGSHPSMTARLMLERKGIPYRRVDLMPVVSKGALRAMRFPSNTVPALRLDGERVQGSMQIGRALDRFKPDPPLYPSGGERAPVEEAERWGDAFQERPRRILWNAIPRHREAQRSYAQGARLGIPIGLAVKTSAPIVALSRRFNDATDDNVRDDLAALPADLERIEGWIADGVIGGAEPNAADYQIAPSVRLLMTLDDLRPAISSRPAGELAMRVVPSFPGRVPPVLPEDWLAPLGADATA